MLLSSLKGNQGTSHTKTLTPSPTPVLSTVPRPPRHTNQTPVTLFLLSQQSAHEDSLFMTLRLTVAVVTYANIDKDGNLNGCRCSPWNNDDPVTVAKLAETWGQSPAKGTSEKGGGPTASSSPAIVQSRAIRVNWSYILMLLDHLNRDLKVDINNKLERMILTRKRNDGWLVSLPVLPV